VAPDQVRRMGGLLPPPVRRQAGRLSSEAGRRARHAGSAADARRRHRRRRPARERSRQVARRMRRVRRRGAAWDIPEHDLDDPAICRATGRPAFRSRRRGARRRLDRRRRLRRDPELAMRRNGDGHRRDGRGVRRTAPADRGFHERGLRRPPTDGRPYRPTDGPTRPTLRRREASPASDRPARPSGRPGDDFAAAAARRRRRSRRRECPARDRPDGVALRAARAWISRGRSWPRPNARGRTGRSIWSRTRSGRPTYAADLATAIAWPAGELAGERGLEAHWRNPPRRQRRAGVAGRMGARGPAPGRLSTSDSRRPSAPLAAPLHAAAVGRAGDDATPRRTAARLASSAGGVPRGTTLRTGSSKPDSAGEG
jgi:hypothetical protein